MKQLSIAMSIADTLRREGLCHLLALVGDCTIVDTRPESTADTEPALWIIDTATLLSHSSFFAMRRRSTAIVTSTPTDTYFNIDPAASTEALAGRLHDILATITPAESSSGTLSPREIDVLRLLARGLINKEIADRLSISINTVLTHRKNISAKLGIKSISGLGIYAVMNGYLAESDL